MLSALLRTIEQAFGASLSPAGDIAFAIGMIMLAYVILAPLIRIVVEIQAARIGMEREWIMHCLTCRRMTVVAGGACEHCGASLGIPWTVRLHHFFARGGEPRWLRLTRWIYSALGIAGYAAVTVIGLVMTGALSPQSGIEKLLVGLSLITWAGLGWLRGRVVGIGTGGPISRMRDAVFSLALVAVLFTTVTLAGAARPPKETVVAQVRVEGQVAQLGAQAVTLSGYQLGFEYMLLEHDFAGFRNITPLAIVGAQRIELPLSERRRDLVDFLWANADILTKRGLTIRKRTDQFIITESGLYEIIVRGDQVDIRQYAPSS